MARAIPIAQFNHRVAVCSMNDVVERDGQMSLRRNDVYHCWAKIVVSVGTLFNGAGDAIKQGRDVRTHKLTVRFRRDIDFTQAAWFYEERLQSGGRWFKLLAMNEVGEAGEYLECEVRLVERATVASPVPDAPACEPAAALPLGVIAVPKGVDL